MENEDVLKLLVDIQASQLLLQSTVGDMSKKLDTLPCAVHSFRIKFLERITYGAVTIVLSAFVLSLVWFATPETVKRNVKHPISPAIQLPDDYHFQLVSTPAFRRVNTQCHRE